MRAVLDHVGIAVERLEPSVHFFRDTLGLHVEAPEDVASQSVRAHLVQLEGLAALELLEATAPESPIAKFVGKRGPGLHHITLRVDDIHAALAHLAARGVRLVDETPRVGAGGSLIAFIHPGAAHGVLVELKQVVGHTARLDVSRPLTVGDMQLRSCTMGRSGSTAGRCSVWCRARCGNRWRRPTTVIASSWRCGRC